MITQFFLLIYWIFSIIHSYDIQNIFSVVFDSASQQSREVHDSWLYAKGQQKNTVLRYTYSLNDRVALIYASLFRDDN